MLNIAAQGCKVHRMPWTLRRTFHDCIVTCRRHHKWSSQRWLYKLQSVVRVTAVLQVYREIKQSLIDMHAMFVLNSEKSAILVRAAGVVRGCVAMQGMLVKSSNV